jgi:alkylated DNA nucleotide flippase Atl1
MMGGRISAAAVGWAMNALGNTKVPGEYNSKTVPWHRVLNSKGGISTKHELSSDADGKPITLQQKMLEQEGVVFGKDNTVDLSKYLWKRGGDETSVE